MKGDSKKIPRIFYQITGRNFFILGEPQFISLKATVEAEPVVDLHMDPTNLTGEKTLLFLILMQLYK